MSARLSLSRRLLVGSVLLGVFVAADVALFGWLLLRSLSEREISRALLETRAEAEKLAEQLAGRAREQGADLYLAVATERETQTYIDSILRQREVVRNLEIRDREGQLVYQMQTKETLPVGEGELAIASPERGPDIEERTFERRSEQEVHDLTVPIGDMGEIRIGLSHEELGRRVGALRQELLRQAAVVGLVTLAVLVTAYFVIWWLVLRGRQLAAKAREAERMAYIGTLAAGLAHEIRNPLNSLSLNMQMLEEDLGRRGPDRSTRRLFSITRSELSRLERLVSDFLAYARPRPLERARLPAVEPLCRVRELLRGQVSSRQAQVRLEDDSEGAFIDVDPQQLGQLLLNLAQNGLNATEGQRRPSVLVLRARREGSQVLLEVEDNGAGIPPEAQPRIFDVFYSTRKGGTGLGLAIAQRIARNHGATLEVESVEGEGSTFRLRLAAVESASPASQPAPAEAFGGLRASVTRR